MYYPSSGCFHYGYPLQKPFFCAFDQVLANLLVLYALVCFLIGTPQEYHFQH